MIPDRTSGHDTRQNIRPHVVILPWQACPPPRRVRGRLAYLSRRSGGGSARLGLIAVGGRLLLGCFPGRLGEGRVEVQTLAVTIIIRSGRNARGG